ncbi:MAG TPA: hypothetical protein VFX89_23015 [Gammaproteobacteria bacterium]|nr:hypothetical protein [Gammaproteobacteria bacterium]
MPLVAAFAVAYFAAVFAVGFAFGVCRVLWLVPAAGERAAELVELPFMILASFVVARALVAWFRIVDRRTALAAGLAALALLVAAELGTALALRGLTPGAYVASRDPVSGGAYAAAVLIFGLLPWLVVRRRR